MDKTAKQELVRRCADLMGPHELPLLSAASSMDADSRKASRKGKRVLVVDDDLDTAQTLFLLLLDMGHSPAYATSGSAALEQAKKLQPEFVFLDIGLPDLDGSEVATRLRQTPGCEQALIIAITGRGEEHRPRMLRAGCDAFYVKPLEPRLIDQFLGG